MTKLSREDLPGSNKAPSSSAVRAELNRVLASPSFSASARKCKFLTYVVEQALGGHGEQLTAYDVALAVFDRDERFDPRSDPLVRITARRVRAALEQYYLTAGRDAPLRISLPKGHYRPSFDWPAAPVAAGASSMQAGAASTPRWPRATSSHWSLAVAALLLVGAAAYIYVAFSLRGQSTDVAKPAPASAATEAALAPEHIVLASVRNVSADPRLDKAAAVITQELKLSFCCTSQFQIVQPNSAADLELEGSIQDDPNGVRVQFLITSTTGKVLWTQTYVVPEVTGTELMDAGITRGISQELVRLRAALR